MSYSLKLTCGCDVYVSCHPTTGVPHSRIIERRDSCCRVRMHEIGKRLEIWELLPARATSASRLPIPPNPRGSSIA